jgi:hypothetical protein
MAVFTDLDNTGRPANSPGGFFPGAHGARKGGDSIILRTPGTVGKRPMSRLNGILADELGIVGFNGTPQQVKCGRSLPVARRESDGKHCVLSLVKDGSAPSWYHEEEAAEFAKARRWTRLREPLPIPRTCISSQDGRLLRQPMVVFAAQSFLDAAGPMAWPDRFQGDDFLWRHLDHQDNSIQAACGSTETVQAMLDDWARELKKRFDAMHQGGEDPAHLKQIADFMLCAAVNRSIRWQAYLRYAMVQEPEKIRQTFDAFTHHEFPDVPWQTYLDEIKGLREVLASVRVAVSSLVTALYRLRGIANRQPIDVCQPTAG